MSSWPRPILASEGLENAVLGKYVACQVLPGLPCHKNSFTRLTIDDETMARMGKKVKTLFFYSIFFSLLDLSIFNCHPASDSQTTNVRNRPDKLGATATSKRQSSAFVVRIVSEAGEAIFVCP